MVFLDNQSTILKQTFFFLISDTFQYVRILGALPFESISF